MSLTVATPAARPGTLPIYPRHLLRRGELDGELVRLAQRRLDVLGCGPVADDGVYGAATEAGVRLFQARFAAVDGHPLSVDGVVGPATFAALFGDASVPLDVRAPSALLGKALQVATTQVGVREDPRRPNRGPQVDHYLRSVGLDPSGAHAWCAAFVYWCFERAAERTRIQNPLPRTAAVLEQWVTAEASGGRRLPADVAAADPYLVKPGFIFVMDTGSGRGHMGIVERAGPGTLVTIEGNTNQAGSREGVGVFRRATRRMTEVKPGFVDYSG
jgi:hypothetical protein